jgi:hypothetical protein
MRRNTISLQTTILSWSLEFITGFLMLMNLLFRIDDENALFRILVPLDITLCTVVVPISYIVKTEDVKKSIVNTGWWTHFKTLLCTRNMRVVPAENVEMNAFARDGVVNVEGLGDEPQLQQRQHEPRIQLAELPDDDENWWMRINLFDDDDLVATGQNSTSKSVEQQGINRVNEVDDDDALIDTEQNCA